MHSDRLELERCKNRCAEYGTISPCIYQKWHRHPEIIPSEHLAPNDRAYNTIATEKPVVLENSNMAELASTQYLSVHSLP